MKRTIRKAGEKLALASGANREAPQTPADPVSRFPASRPGGLRAACTLGLSALTLASTAHARLPEPAAIYFGTAMHRGGEVLYPAGTEMIVLARLGAIQVASATIAADGKFVLKVPMDNGQEPRIQGSARGGERVRIYLRNSSLDLEAEANQSAGLGLLVPTLRGDLTDGDLVVNADLGGLEQPPGFAPFMQSYGLDGVPSETSLDPDQDGFTNLQEFIADTDPTSAADRVQVIQIQRSGGNVTSLQFGPIRVSRLYRIWCSESLSAGTWEEIGQVRPTANAPFRWFDHIDTAGKAGLFFKVEVELE